MEFLLFPVWLLLNGAVTVETVAFGVLVCWAVGRFSRVVFGGSRRRGRRGLKTLLGWLEFALYLLGQIALSNLQVIALVFRPGKLAGAPRLTAFRPPLETAAARMALATAITLTPGTVTASLGEDGLFQVCALDASFSGGFIDSGFVRRLAKLEKEG